jgi:hypothetical protein
MMGRWLDAAKKIKKAPGHYLQNPQNPSEGGFAGFAGSPLRQEPGTVAGIFRR